MRNFLCRFLIGLLLIGIPTLRTYAASDDLDNEIILCNFPLPANLVEGHADFKVGFSFVVNKSGRPEKLSRTLGNQVDVELATQCISKWRFSHRWVNTRLTAYFRWEHGLGWTEIIVVAKHFVQKIRSEAPCVTGVEKRTQPRKETGQ